MHASATFWYNETALTICTIYECVLHYIRNEEIAFAKVNGRLIE